LEKREDGDQNEPEPQEKVDFFIDDVQRQDTQSIKPLHCSTRTELVESAFGHLWKNAGHGIHPFLRRQLADG